MKYTLLLLLVFMTACKSDNKKTPQKSSKEKTNKQTNIPMEKTTYYFIRHAEKNLTDPTDNDPYLTKKGLERAMSWANFFSDKSIEMIYSTTFTRTIQTVVPLLDKTQLDLKFYEPGALYSDEFLAETRGKNVLIVGHQTSIPAAINKIISKNKYEKIPADVYGNLYTVTLHEDGKITSSVEEPKE